MRKCFNKACVKIIIVRFNKSFATLWCPTSNPTVLGTKIKFIEINYFYFCIIEFGLNSCWFTESSYIFMRKWNERLWFKSFKRHIQLRLQHLAMVESDTLVISLNRLWSSILIISQLIFIRYFLVKSLWFIQCGRFHLDFAHSKLIWFSFFFSCIPRIELFKKYFEYLNRLNHIMFLIKWSFIFLLNRVSDRWSHLQLSLYLNWDNKNSH